MPGENSMTIQQYDTFEARLTKSDASNKLAKLWESKANQRALKAGGGLTLALSLAACGADDDTPFDQAAVDTAVSEAEAILQSQITTLQDDKAAVDLLLADAQDDLTSATADLVIADGALTTANQTAASTAADLKVAQDALGLAQEAVNTANSSIERLTNEAAEAVENLTLAIEAKEALQILLDTANIDLGDANSDLTDANSYLASLRADLGLTSDASAQDMITAITAIEVARDTAGNELNSVQTSLISVKTDLGLTADATTQEMISAITAIENARDLANQNLSDAETSLASVKTDLGLTVDATTQEVISAIQAIENARDTAGDNLNLTETSLDSVKTDLGLTSDATTQEIITAIQDIENARDTANVELETSNEALKSVNDNMGSLKADLGLTVDATTQEMIDAIQAIEDARDDAVASLSAIAEDVGLASGATEAEVLDAIQVLQDAYAISNPATVNTYTVTDADLATAIGTAGGVLSLGMVGSPTSATITVESDGLTYTNLILDTDATNTTVIAGDQIGAGDKITIVGTGLNEVTLGAGDDELIVFGNGTTVVDVGAGLDTVILGSGAGTVKFAAGELGLGDKVDGSLGINDTIVFSGTGNVVGALGATVTGVEHYIAEGTVLEIDASNLAAAVTFTGSPETTEVILVTDGLTALDLSHLEISGLEKLIISDENEGSALNLTLTKDQIDQIGEITGADNGTLTITTTVAGLSALAGKVVAGTVGFVNYAVEDNLENIIAGSEIIAEMKATAILENAQTVAEAAAAVASNSEVAYNLQDTAANLALAPEAVFNNAVGVVLEDIATAAQAASINTTINASNDTTTTLKNITVDQLVMQIADTGSNLSLLNVVETVATDGVTSSDALNVLQAIDIYENNSAAVYHVVDTIYNLVDHKSTNALLAATSIEVDGFATIALVKEATEWLELAPGYSILDTFDAMTEAADAAIVNAAGMLSVDGGAITVADAVTMNNFSNTGTTEYFLEDSIGVMLAASATTVGGALRASVTDDFINASQAAKVVTKYTALVFDQSNLEIVDTVPNLIAMDDTVAAEAGLIKVSTGTATVEQAVALDEYFATVGSTVNISDTMTKLTAGASDAVTLAIMEAQGSIALSESASVNDIVTLNGLLTGSVEGYTVIDTYENLSGSEEVVDLAGTVNVVDPISVEEAGNLATAFAITGDDATFGEDIVYTISDNVSVLVDPANGAVVLGATSVTAADAASTAAQAEWLFDAGATYAINGDVAEVHVGADDDDLDGATSVTVTDIVENIEADDVITEMAADSSIDLVIVSDSLTLLDDSRDAGTAVAAADSIIVTDTNLGVDNAAALNSLSALKSTSYDIVDALAHLHTALASTGEGEVNENGAITTLLNNAATITLSDAAVSVEAYLAIAAQTNVAIKADLSDEGANLAAEDADVAVKNGGIITIEDTHLSVEVIEALDSRGLGVSELVAVDTAERLSAMDSELLGSVHSASVKDNGAVTQNVAGLIKIFSDNGSAYGNYSISDTAENVAVANDNNAGLSNFATAVTLSTDATISEAANLEGITLKGGGGISYNVTGTAELLALADSDDMSAAVNLVATTDATIEQATTIVAFTNSGVSTYGISGAISTFIDEDAATQALINAVVEGASGTVTATETATVDQAEVVSALTKDVVYSVSGTPTEIGEASATALNGAVDITSTGTTSNVAQANAVMSATNSGTTRVDTVEGLAADVLNLSIGSNDVITNLLVADEVDATTANAIAELVTGSNIGAVSFGAISDTSDEIATIGDATLSSAGTVTVSNSMSISEYKDLSLDINITRVTEFTLTDTFTNLTETSDPSGDPLNYDNFYGMYTAGSVTVKDVLTIAQATYLLGFSNVNYNIQDNDANIIAALNENSNLEYALLMASTVTAADGTVLDIQTILQEGVNVIAGTKSEIDAMSSILNGDQVAYEVSVADIDADEDFYGNLPSNATFIVSDNSDNLLGGNATLPAAGAIIVIGAVSVADATSITALSTIDGKPTYDLSDTSENLAGASTVGEAAINISATDQATFDQADTIFNFNATTFDVSISQADISGLEAVSANAATDITITGALSHIDAASVLALTNSGSTQLALVNGTSAELAALSVGDAIITDVTASDAATADQINTILGFTTPSAYDLKDTAENLVNLPASILNGATNISLLTGEQSTVDDAEILDALTNSGTTTFSITDSALAILGATDGLQGSENGEVTINDSSISADVATKLTVYDTAFDAFTINHGGNAGVFNILDSFDNLIDAANATAVQAASSVKVIGTIDVAQGVELAGIGLTDATPAYTLSDSYTNLVVNQVGDAALNLTDVSVEVSGVLSVTQAKQALGYSSTAVFSLIDSAENVAADVTHAAVTGATTVVLTTAATVAEAASIADLANLSGGYELSDTAEKVQAAMDRANAGETADIALINGASSITLTDNATVDEAAGVLSTESDGLYDLNGLSYGIADTVTNIAAALVGIDGSAITGASTLVATDATTMSVADAATLTSLSNWEGHDHDSDDTTDAVYYIEDKAAVVMEADATLLNNAFTVVANGTTESDNINLSMHSAGMSINGAAGVDTITGTSGADTINGGAGADTINGGEGADTFVFAALNADSAAAFDVVGGITFDTVAGIDQIEDFVANGADGDLFDLVETVLNVNGAITSGLANENTFIADINALVNVGDGNGFDTDESSDVSAVLVTIDTGDQNGKTFLAVDSNGSDTFTDDDLIIDVTGITDILFTTDTFV
jgi:hypothetical protein